MQFPCSLSLIWIFGLVSSVYGGLLLEKKIVSEVASVEQPFVIQYTLYNPEKEIIKNIEILDNSFDRDIFKVNEKSLTHKFPLLAPKELKNYTIELNPLTTGDIAIGPATYSYMKDESGAFKIKGLSNELEEIHIMSEREFILYTPFTLENWADLLMPFWPTVLFPFLCWLGCYHKYSKFSSGKKSTPKSEAKGERKSKKDKGGSNKTKAQKPKKKRK